MSEPISTDQFSERLAHLVISCLWNQMPATYVAAELVRSAYAVVLGAGIDPDALMADLAGIVDEMNSRQQRDHLH